MEVARPEITQQCQDGAEHHSNRQSRKHLFDNGFPGRGKFELADGDGPCNNGQRLGAHIARQLPGCWPIGSFARVRRRVVWSGFPHRIFR